MSDKSPFYAAAELPDDDTDYEREIATQDRLTTANDLLREAREALRLLTISAGSTVSYARNSRFGDSDCSPVPGCVKALGKHNKKAKRVLTRITDHLEESHGEASNG